MFKRNVISFCFLTKFSFCSPSCAIFSSERGDGRILGGAIAIATTPNRASVASIRFHAAQGSFHTCGGFIINRRWVGTAAQCMTDKTLNNAAVAVGSMAIGGGTIYNLDRIEMHEDFNITSLAHNVAVLRTNTDIIFGANVQPIRVAAESLAAGRAITVLGWGRTTPTSNFSDNLLFTDFTTLTLENCLAGFPYVTRNYISDQHVCTSFAPRATCPGDAGGAFFVDNAAVAIASWVEPCVVGQINVNTRMSSYANWIFNHTRVDD